MTEATLVANYCKGGKSTGGPFVTISVFGDHDQTNQYTVSVKGKVEARKVAKRSNAKPWNF